MTFNIKSETMQETLSFHLRLPYVFVDINDDHPKQICYGGDFTGYTVTTTEKDFKKDCKKWYRQRLYISKKKG